MNEFFHHFDAVNDRLMVLVALYLLWRIGSALRSIAFRLEQLVDQKKRWDLDAD